MVQLALAIVLVFLVLASPLLAAIAIGIKLTSPGPVVFRQKRVSWNNRSFDMLKFRSMPANHPRDAVWSSEGMVKTRFGAFLRKYNLDELLQLVNVLKGGLRVLYLAGFPPRIEYRYLRRALDSSPDIHVDTFGIDPMRPETRPGDLAERLTPGNYEVLILGDLDSTASEEPARGRGEHASGCDADSRSTTAFTPDQRPCSGGNGGGARRCGGRRH